MDSGQWAESSQCRRLHFCCVVTQAEQEVWATVLALVWLHGFKLDSRDEWELLAMKAAAWLRERNGNDAGSPS